MEITNELTALKKTNEEILTVMASLIRSLSRVQNNHPGVLAEHDNRRLQRAKEMLAECSEIKAEDILKPSRINDMNIQDFFKKWTSTRPNLKVEFHDAGIEAMAFAEAYHKEQLRLHNVSISATSKKDYTGLFDKISKGEVVPCFVDYGYRDEIPRFRDVAKIIRYGEADIDIGARGISYGGVSEYDLKNKTELKAFTDECERLNLEYYT